MSATISDSAGATRDKTDRQLLDRFVAHQDQGAFAALVARHGACVWAVCRRVLGQEQDAEDAFQAVFLILGRKAATIRKRDSVASWLHGVAFRTAMKLRRSGARRKAREQVAGAAMPESSPAEQAAVRELQRILDEEVARLAEIYRSPFVLCCLEGLTRSEAAKELGVNEGTLSSRLAQARALLQKRLAQLGFTLSAVLTLSALVESSAAAAVPPALAQTAVQAGVTGNAAAAFSPSVVALADSIGHALAITKLKTALASVLLTLLTAAAGFTAYEMTQPDDRPPPAQEKPAPPPVPNKPPVVVVAKAKPSDIWSAAISRDGKRVAAGAGWWNQPGEVGVWDLETRELLMHSVEKRGIASVAFSPDGTLLASGSWTGNVRLRKVPTGEEVADFKIPRASRVAFSPDGSLLAAASEGKTVHLIDPAKRKIICALEGDLFRFIHVIFSPDGKLLLAGGGDWEKGGVCQVTIWDVKTRKQVGKLIGHELAVLCIAYSPDGKTIATGAVDKTIRLWDADTFADIKVLPGHEGSVEALAFSPDGKTLLSGGLDGAMRFWDPLEGREIARLGPPPAGTGAEGPIVAVIDKATAWSFPRSVRAIHFLPDGATLLVGGGPRSLRLYDFATRKETAVFCKSITETDAGITPAALQGVKRIDKEPAKADDKPLPPPRVWQDQTEILFGKGIDTHPDLRLFGPDADTVAKTEPEGLRITLPAKRDNNSDVGVESQKVLRGDFEVTLAYELLAVPNPGPDGGAGAVLEAFFDGLDAPKARIARTQKLKAAFFGSTFYLVNNDGNRISHALQYPRANAKVQTGHLRLTRTGAELAFQVEEGDTGFRTIATKEVGNADVVSVRAFATTGSKAMPLELRFKSLDLKSAHAPKKTAPLEPIDDGNQPAPRSRSWLPVAAFVFVAMGLCMVAAMLIVIYRRGTAAKASDSES